MRQDIYEPREDSFMMEKCVLEYSKGCSLVLDMGTGSGILAFAASKHAKQVLCCDINKNAVEHVLSRIKNENRKNVFCFESDLFSYLNSFYFDSIKNCFIQTDNKNQFDLIIFNAPYLPLDKGTEDAALYGGKVGHEVTERFISNAANYLSDKGNILLTCSSTVGLENIREIIAKNLMIAKVIDSFHAFFETVYVLLIKKTNALVNLHEKGVSEISYYAKGKRGYISLGKFDNKKIAVKVLHKNLNFNRIENEVNFLKLLNKKGIGSQLLFYGNDYFAYTFVEGELIVDFINSSQKFAILDIIKKILAECYTMDCLGINKLEMHHPIKHIIVRKNGNDAVPVMIDFERARFTKDPKNVTQFFDFLIGDNISEILSKKEICLRKEYIIPLLKAYKKEMSERNYNALIAFLENKIL
ncbi:MAG: methyltransferase [archaeon]